MNTPKTEANQATPWMDYSRRRRWFFGVWLTYIPGVFMVSYSSGALFHIPPPFTPIALTWMAAFAVTGWRCGHFPCPRCGRRFFYRGPWSNPFARRCMHCGLAKWSEALMNQAATPNAHKLGELVIQAQSDIPTSDDLRT